HSIDVVSQEIDWSRSVDVGCRRLPLDRYCRFTNILSSDCRRLGHSSCRLYQKKVRERGSLTCGINISYGITKSCRLTRKLKGIRISQVLGGVPNFFVRY